MKRIIQQWFQSLIFLAFLLIGGAPAFAAVAAVCDVDKDGDVDRLDINLIFAARNQPASAGDPRDADGNGTINVLDGRKCTLQCSLPNCAIKNPNTPPRADAGPDQTGYVGKLITLDGAASSDADGNPLSFTWALQPPAGSAAALSDPEAVSPQFTLDQKGDYIAQLIVNDGQVNSAPDEVKITTSNSAPVANAGPDQSLTVAATVTLNGAGSSDVDGDPLTFAWSFTDMPASSSAFLSDSTSVNPQFVADRPGRYVLNLVVNDGTVDSDNADEVVISSENIQPVAHAGLDQTVPAGASVTLDGSGSSDAEGQALTYQWSLTSIPPGSAAALPSPTVVNPNFVADLPGLYVAQLTINDGYVDSLPDTVEISTTNSAPVANAGPDQTVVAGASVQLDGAGSTDVDGNPISYRWSFTARPTGSSAVLSDATAVNPTFTADVLDDYVLQLIVNDGFVDSAPDTVQISTTNSAPVANAGPDQTVALGSPVQLNGSASGDADHHPLTYSWSLTGKPTGSAATLSSFTAVDPSFVADRPGNYVVQLVVNDGFVNSPADTVQISTINSVPVANAGPDQSVPSGTTSVTLDGSGSSDADGNPLTYQWSILTAPTGSTAALSDPTAQNPTLGSAALPLIAGTYVLQLIVNDGQVNSTPATMTLVVGSGPAAPSDLIAMVVFPSLFPSQINLAWTDNSDNDDGFKIEYKIGAAGTWTKYNEMANYREHSILHLTSSTTYCFQVQAYNASGDSAYSNEACATTHAPDYCRENVTLNHAFDAWLTTECISSRSGYYAKFYTFTLNSNSYVYIAMTPSNSPRVDPYIILRSGTAVNGPAVALDYDGVLGDEPRLFLNRGTYTVEATTDVAGQTGSFTFYPGTLNPPL